MDVDAPEEFWARLDRYEAEARGGDRYAKLMVIHVTAALKYLRELPEAPDREGEPTATLKPVRQSRRYELWRVSHAFHAEVAVRVICWFPPKSDTVVVALLAGDKLRAVGDSWYDAVPNRADPLIDSWKRETSYDGE